MSRREPLSPSTILETVRPIAEAERQRAARNIVAMYQHGELPPIDGIDGDMLRLYGDMLGLNKRQMRSSKDVAVT